MNPDENPLHPILRDAGSPGGYPRESPLAFLGLRLVWVPLGLLALVGGGLYVHSVRSAAAKPASPVRAVPVTVAMAQKREMDVNYTGLGTVVTLDTVTVRSRVDGQVMKIGFQEGQMVRQGGLLAEIDARPFTVQLMQAQGQLAKDEAALKSNTKDLQRFNTLVKQGIISTQQEDAQTSLVDQSAAAVKVDQAAVASARLNLTYSHITSPIAGRAGLRLVDAGNLVHATDTTGIVVITPVQPINVMFTLPTDQLQAVREAVNRGHALTVEAYDRDLTTRLAEGTLQAMDNQIDTATGTFKLKALFKNENLALFPNQFVNIRLKVETFHGALVIPSAALQRSPQGTYLYVVKADKSVEMRTVQVRYTDGDSTAIRTDVPAAETLSAGETVVTEGLEKLRPGIKVSSTPPEAKGAPRAGK